MDRMTRFVILYREAIDGCCPERERMRDLLRTVLQRVETAGGRSDRMRQRPPPQSERKDMDSS